MGKYNITSSSQLIDIATITRGCNQIENAAEKFEESAKKVFSASDICNAKALSIDKTTMEKQLDADGEYIKSIKKAINDFTLQIKNVALQIYAEQQTELTEYEAQLRAAAATATTTSATQQTGITSVTNSDGSVTTTEVDAYGNTTVMTSYPSGQQTINYQPAQVATPGTE